MLVIVSALSPGASVQAMDAFVVATSTASASTLAATATTHSCCGTDDLGDGVDNDDEARSFGPSFIELARKSLTGLFDE